MFGIWGSYVCAILNFLCLAAQFYVALWPVGGPNLDPTTFFQDYLAGPFLLVLYIGYKGWSWFFAKEARPLYIKIKDIDVYSGLREGQLDRVIDEEKVEKSGPMGWAKSIVGAVF